MTERSVRFTESFFDRLEELLPTRRSRVQREHTGRAELGNPASAVLGGPTRGVVRADRKTGGATALGRGVCGWPFAGWWAMPGGRSGRRRCCSVWWWAVDVVAVGQPELEVVGVADDFHAGAVLFVVVMAAPQHQVVKICEPVLRERK